MAEQEQKVNYTQEPPRQVDFHNICFWDAASLQLLKRKRNGDNTATNILGKAKDFLYYNCIEQIGENAWICKPIKGYNKQTLNITKAEGVFRCTCLGYHTKERDEGQGYCSHTIATEQFISIDRYNRGLIDKEALMKMYRTAMLGDEDEL